MNKAILFNFNVDKANNQIKVERSFNAPIELVWSAWTVSEILDQWWAPKPWVAETKSLDFREGGQWLYAMVSPVGERQWCKADYKEIKIQETLSWLDAFCDENGIENEMKPRSFWVNKFIEHEGSTIVNITMTHEKLEDLEMLIEMGFKEGFTAGLENLDHYLQNLT
ncbi:SRPBCC family protein [Cecembia rubra]|uniref:SRPBCC family protein n=1 Tax=Cecembia rubra TaxID=1485585 RepID=UPI0027145C4C|nr:SRPBCC domain-containing protein [Cecembia rubra]